MTFVLPVVTYVTNGNVTDNGPLERTQMGTHKPGATFL